MYRKRPQQKIYSDSFAMNTTLSSAVSSKPSQVIQPIPPAQNGSLSQNRHPRKCTMKKTLGGFEPHNNKFAGANNTYASIQKDPVNSQHA